MTAPTDSQAVSVVIPTYNRAALIRETLDAIFAQRVGCEVIVVDDGSTDNTTETLGRYGARIKAIKIENSGDLVARNVGLREARGDLVAFCDSDDVWEPQFLEIMHKQWEVRPDLVSCYANFRIWKDGRLSAKTKFDDAPLGFWTGFASTNKFGGAFDRAIVEHLIEFQPLFTSCMMVNREKFLELGGWDEGVSRVVGCDFATALRAANAPPLGLVTEPLVRIRKHRDSISSDVENMNLGDAQVLDYVLSARPELERHRAKIEASCSKRRAEAMDSAFARGDYPRYLHFYGTLLPKDRTAKRKIKRSIAAIRNHLRSGGVG